MATSGDFEMAIDKRAHQHGSCWTRVAAHWPRAYRGMERAQLPMSGRVGSKAKSTST
jgi:hypothetical protein